MQDEKYDEFINYNINNKTNKALHLHAGQPGLFFSCDEDNKMEAVCGSGSLEINLFMAYLLLFFPR